MITDTASKEKVKREIDRLASMDKQSSDYGKILTYLDEVFSIPWNKYTTPYWNIPKTNEILDDSIYGLQKVKDRIIEMIAVNKLKGEKKENKGYSENCMHFFIFFIIDSLFYCMVLLVQERHQ